MNLIIIDAGHGGNDPGTHCEGMTEKQANLETALTVKHMLTQAGYPVKLTRSGDTRPSFGARTQHIPGTLAYISIHYNQPKSYGLVYYESEDYMSMQLATHLAREAGLSRIWASRRSNHAGLYIDRVGPPAIMYEVAGIDDYPQNKEVAREFRMKAGWAVIRAVLRWHWERMQM